MERLKSVVAVVLALAWLPAASCCWVDASGLLGKQDCCAKEHPQPISAPGHCDKACGMLASGAYCQQQSQWLVIVPLVPAPFDLGKSLMAISPPDHFNHELPATAPPALADPWQFALRAALSPRAPSLVS